MADIPAEIPDDLFGDPISCQILGAKVLEMAERLDVVNAVAPGAVAFWQVEIDGTWYELKMQACPAAPARSG